MSILRILSLERMYGTTEFAIDRSSGQLYKIGDVDVTPVNLFGGIPDEDLGEGDIESMTSLLKKPQAMSTPITDVTRNMPMDTLTKDGIPLPTPMLPPLSQEERKTRSSMGVAEDVSPEAPIFNLNRANVQVASSVSSLEEGEGIVNEDEYEKAVQRLTKINKKITILMQNWNEESKQARNTNDITEIEEFYRPYMDQYTNRQKELERLMEMYSDYCESKVSPETSHQKHMSKQQIPPSASQIQQTSHQETIPKDVLKRRKQINQPLEAEETILKKGMDKRSATIVSSTTLEKDTISSTLPSTTRPFIFPNISVDTTTKDIGRMKTLPQGRMSTLSSMVSPMPTTATRTIAITREESHQDALETVRQMIGPISSSTVLPMLTITTDIQEPSVNTYDSINTFTNEVRPRIPSAHLDFGMTDMTTPIGMAMPIAPDLVWPGHPDVQGTNLFPRDDDPTTISAGGLDPDERWKIHHPYNIPGVHRPTMDIPDNLRRLAESEALVESLQTMEYLTEFPTLEERWDFRRFPPRYGDPHYHPSRLKKHDDGRSRQRPGDERTSIFGSSLDREPRRNVLGRGGFMSPMRWIAESVHRVPSVQNINIENTMENLPDITVNDQWDDNIEATPELNPNMNNNIPSTVDPSQHGRENTSGDPEIVVEHVPLLNGGPSTSQQVVVTPIPTTEAITSTTAPTGPTLIEAVTISSTPPDDSMGISERVPLTEPICLTAEDLQIRCTVCNTIDCVIHNPRHRYCMDCGQRLLGLHVCSNRMESTAASRS